MDRPTIDFRLPALKQFLAELLAASRRWSQKVDFDQASVEATRHRALLLNHERYLGLIPAYRRFAEELGLLDIEDVNVIFNELMFTDEIFKSYDTRCLESGDFVQMTRWLGDIFLREPNICAEGIDNILSWRKRLLEDEIYLSYSSWTSGRFSFVPRDRLTWTALCRNGGFYTPTVFDGRAVSHSDFDCLVLGFRGIGMGIQSAGSGLAQVASRAHFLYGAEMSPEFIRTLMSGSRNAAREAVTEHLVEATGLDKDGAYAQSFEFLRRAKADERPVLIFGTPFQIREVCCRILDEIDPFRLPPQSIVVSGGGWKSFEGERIENDELLEGIEMAFGVPRSHVIDTYSTSELNCVLMSCPESRYHIPPLVEPVVLDELLSPVAGDDASGILGFLDPFAVSYPGFVITGDSGRLVRGRCRCGLTGWSIVGEIQRAPEREIKGCGGVMASLKA